MRFGFSARLRMIGYGVLLTRGVLLPGVSWRICVDDRFPTIVRDLYDSDGFVRS